MWQVLLSRFINPIVKGKVRTTRQYTFISVKSNEKVYNIWHFSHSFSLNIFLILNTKVQQHWQNMRCVGSPVAWFSDSLKLPAVEGLWS